MNETLSIPLNKLVAWDGNVRRTGASEAIDELAASITAHGLLQALVVRKVPGKKGNGKYAVIAGRRRLQALQLLTERGDLATDSPVPCQPIDDTADAGEISLAENVVRVAMHPADQFEAFRDLLERGTDVSAIAARFGVSEMVVAKRLKLGRLSPVVLAAYRAGDIGLEEAQAYTIVDDHAAQERVLAETADRHYSPSYIRRRLTEDEVCATDKRVRFIGLAAYEDAGGAVRRDLFDDEDSGTIVDIALLDRLVNERLVALANEVRAEGWAWVEIALDGADMTEFRRLKPETRKATDDEQARLAILSTEHEALTYTEDGDEVDPDDVTCDRIETIEATVEAIKAGLAFWSPETLAQAGAIVTLDWDGEVDIERGLVRRSEEPSATEERLPVRKAPTALPATLVADLTAQKTAAMQVAFAGNVDVALATAIHALALPVFYRGGTAQSCLQLSLRDSWPAQAMAAADESKALQQLAEREDAWTRALPQEVEALWPWCLAQNRDTLLALLAFVVAQGVNAIQQ